MYIIRKDSPALRNMLFFANDVDDILDHLPDDRDEAHIELESMDVIVVDYDPVAEEFKVNEATINKCREVKFMPMLAVVEIVSKGWTLRDIDKED